MNRYREGYERNDVTMNLRNKTDIHEDETNNEKEANKEIRQ